MKIVKPKEHLEDVDIMCKCGKMYKESDKADHGCYYICFFKPISRLNAECVRILLEEK